MGIRRVWAKMGWRQRAALGPIAFVLAALAVINLENYFAEKGWDRLLVKWEGPIMEALYRLLHVLSSSEAIAVAATALIFAYGQSAWRFCVVPLRKALTKPQLKSPAAVAGIDEIQSVTKVSNNEPFGGQMLAVPTGSAPVNARAPALRADPATEPEKKVAAKEKIGLLTRDVFSKAREELTQLIAVASENFAARYGNGEFRKALREGLDGLVSHDKKQQRFPLRSLADLENADKLRDMTCREAESLFYNHHCRYNDSIRLLNESLEYAKPFYCVQFKRLHKRYNAWKELHERLIAGILDIGRDLELPTIATMLTVNPQPEMPPPIESFDPNPPAKDVPRQSL